MKGIDVILGGHDHDPVMFYEGGVFIFKVGHDAHYLGVTQIRIEKTQTARGPQVKVWPREWRVVSTAGVAPDPAIAAIVKGHEDKLDESLKVAVGKTTVELDSRRATVRLREAAIGNLLPTPSAGFTKADAGLTNGGGIRGDRTYPADTVLRARTSSTELPFWQRHGAARDQRRRSSDGAGGRGQLRRGRRRPVSARVRHALRLRSRRPKGSRVLEVTIGGKPLDPSATYKVATNEYMMAGGDGYESLKKGRPIIDASGGPLMANVADGLHHGEWFGPTGG